MKLLYVATWSLFLFTVPALGRGFETTYFDKKIDLVDWVQKARLPLPELIRAVQKDLDLYRFQNPAGSTSTEVDAAVLQLPIAPTAILNNYKRDITLSGAIGIYMPVEQLSHLISKPTLLIREDSKHWAVLHEYTHHLFHEARQHEGSLLPSGYLTTYSDHAETLQESYARFKAQGEQFKNQAHREELLLCLKIAADIRIKMLLQFELEEISIESLIRNLYDHNRNENFEHEYYDNSSVYIQNSVDRALKSLDGFILMIDEVASQLDPNEKDLQDLQKLRLAMAELTTQLEIL